MITVRVRCGRVGAATPASLDLFFPIEVAVCYGIHRFAWVGIDAMVRAYQVFDGDDVRVEAHHDGE